MINESVLPTSISGQQAAIYILRAAGFVYSSMAKHTLSQYNYNIKTSLCSKEPEDVHRQAGGADFFPCDATCTTATHRTVTPYTTTSTGIIVVAEESLKFIPHNPLNVNSTGRFDTIFTT